MRDRGTERISGQEFTHSLGGELRQRRRHSIDESLSSGKRNSVNFSLPLLLKSTSLAGNSFSSIPEISWEVPKERIFFKVLAKYLLAIINPIV